MWYGGLELETGEQGMSLDGVGGLWRVDQGVRVLVPGKLLVSVG